MRRQLHPGAWWAWAIGVAVTVSMTTNPLLLVLGLAVVLLVVSARREATPWGRAFRFYLMLGAVIVGIRIVLHVLVGLKFGTIRLLPLPQARMPRWAAGIELGGTVYLEGLLAAALEGARLALMIVAIGAANALASPKRLLRILPAALHEIGAALVVAVAVAPQLAAGVQRVIRARRLRGDSARGLRSLRQVAMPVLQDTLDRSLLLAAAMDARGYGRRPTGSTGSRAMPLLTLSGLVATGVGVYGLLDSTSPALIGGPLLAVGSVLGILGLWVGGRSVPVTTYRADPWRLPEWATLLSGVTAAAAMLITIRVGPQQLAMPLVPSIGWPGLPLVPVAGLLAAAVPAFVTPLPPLPSRRTGARAQVTTSRERVRSPGGTGAAPAPGSGSSR